MTRPYRRDHDPPLPLGGTMTRPYRRDHDPPRPPFAAGKLIRQPPAFVV